MNSKQYFILFIIVNFLSLKYIYAQDPTIGLITNKENSDEGLTLFTPEDNQKVYLIESCGYVLNEWEFTDKPNRTAYLRRNGDVVRAGIDMLAIRDWDNNLKWSVPRSLLGQHHDIEPLPNGNILVIAYDEYSKSEILEKGMDENFSEDSIRLDKILEIKPLSTNDYEIVWEWKLYDHLVQDLYPSLDNYGPIADNIHRFDINYNQEFNFCHFNSIDYNADLDQILVSARNLSEIFIIDHSTTKEEAALNSGGHFGKGGDILWRYGNLNILGEAVEETNLYRQHDAKWVEKDFNFDGSISVFNNNPGGFSKVCIVTPVLESNTYSKTLNQFEPTAADICWEGEIAGTRLFENRKSGVTSLKNGHFLICETNKGRISEIDEEGELFWSYVVPHGTEFFEQGAAIDGFNGIFRSVRYEQDFLEGIALELSFDLSTIESTNMASENCRNVILPIKAEIETARIINPVKNGVLLITEGASQIEDLKVYSQTGELIVQVEQPSNRVVLKGVNPGLYHLFINDGNLTTYKKLILE